MFGKNYYSILYYIDKLINKNALKLVLVNVALY
jgi:hypothetical protein